MIGHDVWTWSGSIILPGLRIGDGAVIGTRAFVMRDLDRDAIVGGAPTKIRCHGFDAARLERLLKTRWSDWPEENLRAARPQLCSGDVAGLYEGWRKGLFKERP